MAENNITNKNIYSLDSDSRIPFYFQIKQIILKEIDLGNLKPGDMLPYEGQLCEKFGVSRTVIRQALQELKNENYIITKKGKGTFIAKPKINENIIQNLLGFYETWTSMGFKVENEVLIKEKIVASEKIANILQIKKGSFVIFLKRLSKLNGTPYSISTNYISFDIAPGILNDDFRNIGLYTLLENKYSAELTHGRSFIEISLANKEEAEMLKIKKGDPLFLLEGTSFLENWTPVVYYYSLQLGERSRIQVELVKNKSVNDKKNIDDNTYQTGFSIKDFNKENH